MFVQKHRCHHSRARFFERRHGTGFLRFEMDPIRRFAAAKRVQGNAEIDGYMASVPPHFVLLPAPTAAGTYVVCRAGGFRHCNLSQIVGCMEVDSRRQARCAVAVEVDSCKWAFGRSTALFKTRRLPPPRRR